MTGAQDLPERFVKVYYNWLRTSATGASAVSCVGHRIPVWYRKACAHMNVAAG
jgi:valyl-tRNA synthetase